MQIPDVIIIDFGWDETKETLKEWITLQYLVLVHLLGYFLIGLSLMYSYESFDVGLRTVDSYYNTWIRPLM